MGIYPKDTHSYHEEICTTIFIAALFVIVRTCKQSRCPSAKGRIKKMWYIYTMEYYSEVKSNDILKFACKWMELGKKTFQSEVT